MFRYTVQVLYIKITLKFVRQNVYSDETFYLRTQFIQTLKNIDNYALLMGSWHPAIGNVTRLFYWHLLVK